MGLTDLGTLLKMRHNQKLGVEWNEHLKHQKAL